MHFRETPPPERSMQLSVAVPEAAYVGFVTISPDGSRLTLNFAESGQRPQIYLRAIDSGQLQPLTGSTMARTPFWSPDSRFLAFFADDTLKVVTGGRWPCPGARALRFEQGWAEAAAGVATACCCLSPIAASSCAAMRAAAIAVSSGAPRVSTRFPFSCRTAVTSSISVAIGAAPTQASTWHRSRIPSAAACSAISPASCTRLARPPLAPTCCSFARGTSMAQAFDDERLQLVSDPFAIASPVSQSATPPQVAASAATDGTLVFVAGSEDTQLTWFDRTRQQSSARSALRRGNTASSCHPTRKSVVTERETPGVSSDFWLYDLDRGPGSRVAAAAADSSGVWSSDSRRLWFPPTWGRAGAGIRAISRPAPWSACRRKRTSHNVCRRTGRVTDAS